MQQQGTWLLTKEDVQRRAMRTMRETGKAPLVAITTDPDDTASYERANAFANTLRQIGCTVSVTPIIPDYPEFNRLEIRNYKNVYAIFDEYHGKGLKTVVCGSFKRNIKDIQSAIAKFNELEVKVLSPTEPEIIEEIDDSNHSFAILEGDTEYEESEKGDARRSDPAQSILHFYAGFTPRIAFEMGYAYACGKIPPRAVRELGYQNDLRWQIEQRHCEKIPEADFVWISCPDGYVGSSTAFEMGVASLAKKRMYSQMPPSRGVFRAYTWVAKSIEEAVAVEQCIKMRRLHN